MQEAHDRRETSHDKFRRTLKKYGISYDERYLRRDCPFRANILTRLDVPRAMPSATMVQAFGLECRILPCRRTPMPNGFAKKRDAIWKRSRVWGAVWSVGDMLYYIGLLSSVIAPLIVLYNGLWNFDSWRGLLRYIFGALVAFLTAFPLCLGWSIYCSE
jgi:hypothetical protein